MTRLAMFVVAAAAAGCVAEVDGTEGDFNENGVSSFATGLEWPNSASRTNSDAWLREHHTQISRLHPRVLVLVANNLADLGFVKEKTENVVTDLRAASEYHRYVDGSAIGRFQLDYSVIGFVDARDGGPDPWPADWPVYVGSDGKHHFNYDGLFTQGYAKHFGFVDPDDPSRYLKLCDLFERGIINELWVSSPRVEGNPLGVYESRARIQMYDADDQPLAGQFMDDMGVATEGKCKVTTRMSEIATDTTGVWSDGGDLHAHGHAYEATPRAIPELMKESKRFWNFDLASRLHLGFYSEYDACSKYPADCFRYASNHAIAMGPDANTATSGAGAGANTSSTAWGTGCGNVHFPPNARWNYDYHSTIPVLDSCLHYGMHDGPGGKDLPMTFTASVMKTTMDKELDWEDRLDDQNGGNWEVYLFQSMPSYGTKAKNDDGTPMKSWWVYQYY